MPDIKALFKSEFTVCEVSHWYVHTYMENGVSRGTLQQLLKLLL